MKRVWVTKDGRHLRIREMSTEHIKNCIGMLRRYHAKRLHDMMTVSAMVTGDIARQSIDDGLADIAENGFEDAAEEYITAFEEELRRRGIDV